MRDFDYIAAAKAIRGSLDADELVIWKTRIDDAIATGSTGTEILMALRGTMKDLLRDEPGMSPQLRAKATAFISAANELLS